MVSRIPLDRRGPIALNAGTPLPAPTVGAPQMAGMMMNQLGGGGLPPIPGMGAGAMMPGMPIDAMSDTGDPVLAELMGAGTTPPFDPYAELPDTKKPGYMPPMDPGVWREVANHDQEFYRRLIRRFSRDLMLYRQRYSEKPPGFDPKREVAFRAATITNIVNKLTNMASALDFRYSVPFKDEASKQASQVVENWYTSMRKQECFEHTYQGGHANLQWEEFFYANLYGRISCRILPKPEKKPLPFDIELLDPATLYPVWGGANGGLLRITHRRPATAIDVIATYMPYAPNLDEKLRHWAKDRFGGESTEYRKFYHLERELIECWDTWNRWVGWGDIDVLDVAHELGEVPFVYVPAKGEPRGLTTPNQTYYINRMDSDDPDIEVSVTAGEDQAEKGVSVFHAAINTHRLSELVYTILTTEVIKAGKPPVINYGAAQGELPAPMDWKPGGTNYRILNAQRVEIAPTSPRPTDTSPVMSKLTNDIIEGTINPAAYGNVEGSNIAGYAIESMVAAAKDTMLPYMECFATYQAMKASMMCRLYVKEIAPLGTMTTPMEGKYGNAPSAEVTPDVLAQTGHQVTVQIIGVSDQQLPMLVNAAGSAVERGFWSRRHAMEKLGEKDPSRMNQEIILERALEHPEMMENFLIPINFIRSGQKDLADLWVLMIVMPKIQALMAKMLGPMAGGAMGGVNASGAAAGDPMAQLAGMAGPPGMLPPGPGGTPPAPPEMNGQSNPMAGRAMGPPTGPQPGQGRGPAPAQAA